jgi:serine/threonine protein phosphatase PrpC
MRDMRDALGALGPVDGTNPELGNLTCAMTELEEGDIVFLTSDGVSDNLDPVVGKFTGLLS